MGRFFTGLLSLIFVLMFHLPPASAAITEGNVRGKVLVVMSYDDRNDTEREIAKGIDQVLIGHTIRYFYMDTKNHLELAAVNAKKAYAIYQEFQPDVVIAADDSAQESFVLPYLMQKVSTPVVFCGVNDSAEHYGYPNTQVTGIVEKKHYRQSIIFAHLIDPGIQKIAVVYRDTPANAINLAQIKREAKEYEVALVDFVAVETKVALLNALAQLEKKADALLVLNLGGITGPNGEKMEVSEAMALAAKAWPKLSIGGSKNEIEAGILCGVVKVNLEQGLVAARMAKEILHGKTPAEIPSTENQNGQRVINATTANRLGLKLKPMVLIGSDIVQ